MDNFMKYFKAKELQLSICYRCPKNIVKLAQTIVPKIETYDKQKDGIVDSINTEQMLTELEYGDMVLCRTNAPLVELAFKLIRLNKKVTIRGRDSLCNKLIEVIKQQHARNLDDLEKKLNKLATKQQQRLTEIEMGTRKKEQKKMLMENLDQIHTIKTIILNVTSVKNLIDTINEFFDEKWDEIILSSIHKAKGLENDRIFIYKYDELLPHPMARSQKERQQEQNLKYVAITRAQSELYLVDDEVV